MTNYYFERIGQALFTVVFVVTLSFALIRLMPGGPMDYLMAQFMNQMGSSSERSREEIQALVETYTNINPGDPLWVAYVDYVTALLQGDLGKSLWYNQSVSRILADALPWTLFVMSISLMFSFSFGVTFGAVMAYFEGGRFDVSMSTVSILLTSTPFYILAFILLYFFAYQTRLLPTGGRLGQGVKPGLSVEFIVSALRHAALPIASIVITEFGGWALSMRGNSIRVLGEDYLRVARLRGISSERIAMRYVGRNAILPLYTGLMIGIGFLFGGAVILEQVFTYPGVGYYMLQALSARDYPLLMGGFIVITIAVVIGVLAADLTYGMIDPRLETGGERRESY